MSPDDFTTGSVPEKSRVFGVNILLAWTGFILVVASMSFGGGLAGEMRFGSLVQAILWGNAFLAVCGFVSGYVGSWSGLSFGSLAARVFTKNSWRLAILYIPLSLIGWYAIESSIFGNFVANTFGLGDLVRRLIMAAAAIFFSVSAYFGVRFIGGISYILIPTVVAVSLFALSNVHTSSTLLFGFGPQIINSYDGAAIVMSTWIFSVLLVVPDLTRFIRSPLIAGVAGALGVFLGNTAALGIGAFAAAYTRQSDPSLILVGLGFTPLALILTFASVWSTNDNNMYSSSLSVARAFSLPRRGVVLALALLGAVIAMFNPATIPIMFGFLAFMGASAPPLGGIVIGGYIFSHGSDVVENGLVAPWAAWLLASAITFQLHGVIIIPGGLLLGMFFWQIFNRLEKLFMARRRVASAL